MATENDTFSSGTVTADGKVVGQDYVRVGSGYVIPHANPNPKSGLNVTGFDPNKSQIRIIDDPDLAAVTQSNPTRPMTAQNPIKPVVSRPVATPAPAPVQPTPPPPPVEVHEEDSLDNLIESLQAEADTHPETVQMAKPVPTDPTVQRLLDRAQRSSRPSKIINLVTREFTLPVHYHSVDLVIGERSDTPLIVLGWDLECVDHVQPPTFTPSDWGNPLTIMIQDTLLTCIYPGISFVSRGYRDTILFYDPERTVQVSNDQDGKSSGTNHSLRVVR